MLVVATASIEEKEEEQSRGGKRKEEDIRTTTTPKACPIITQILCQKHQTQHMDLPTTPVDYVKIKTLWASSSQHLKGFTWLSSFDNDKPRQNTFIMEFGFPEAEKWLGMCLLLRSVEHASL